MGMFANNGDSKVESGKIVSLGMFCFLVGILPRMMREIWGIIVHYGGKGFLLYWSFLVSLNIVLFIVLNMLMYLVYTNKWQFFEKYRISKKPWPWEQDEKKWNRLLKRTLKIVFFNMFILNTVVMSVQYFLQGQTIRFKLSVEEWPSTFTVLWQIIVFIIVEDAMFYTTHRILHHHTFYWIHKLHHQYTTSVSLAATYSHPLQYLFGNTFASAIGFSLLSHITEVHLMTIVCFFIFRVVEAVQGHCGYNFTWTQLSFLPFRLRPEYHDFHHSHNIGNYGSMFWFWDTILETNKQFKKLKQK